MKDSKIKINIMGKDLYVTDDELVQLFEKTFTALEDKLPLPSSVTISTFRTWARESYRERKEASEIALGAEILEAIPDRKQISDEVFDELKVSSERKNLNKYKLLNRITSSIESVGLIDYDEEVSQFALDNISSLETEQLVALSTRVSGEYQIEIDRALEQKDPSEVESLMAQKDEIAAKVFKEAEEEKEADGKDEFKTLRKIVDHMHTAFEMDYLINGGYSYDAQKLIKDLPGKQLVALYERVSASEYITEINKALGKKASFDPFLKDYYKSIMEKSMSDAPSDKTPDDDQEVK